MELFVVAIIGLVIGSFLNVLIDRLPIGEDVFITRSHCDSCKKTLRWYELVPLVSYVFLVGKCQRCKHPLSIQYPLIELVTAASLVLLKVHYSGTFVSYILLSLLICVAIVITIADLKS